MAVHLATSSDYLKRTTALLPASGNSTVAFWVRLPVIATGANTQVPYAIADTLGIYTTNYVSTFLNDTVTELEVNGNDIDGATIGNNTWAYLAWTQSGTTQRWYINGTSIGTHTVNRAAVTDVIELLGSDTIGALGDVDIAYCREWTVALNQTQILAELQSTTAVHTANLWMDCPLTSNAVDISGNGHSWTSIGSPTYVAGPSFPANSTAATATAFSTLPQTITQDFGDGLYAWFSYTGHANEVEAGFWALADINVDSLTTKVYEADGTTAFLDILSGANVPIQVPQSNGTTILLYVQATASPSVDVTISGVPGPTTAVPIGSLMINDDEVGFPLAMLSATSAAPLQFAPYPAGELVEVTPVTGQTLSNDIESLQLQLFTGDLSSAMTIAYPTASTLEGISSDQAGLYYLGFQNKHVYTVDDTGVVGSTSWVLTNNVVALAPSLDNTILYYASGVAASPIYRWDLVNDVGLSDLAAGVASHIVVRDLLVLQDGTIVAGYQKNTATTDYFVRNYSAAGATLHTYSSFGAGNKVNRLTHAIDDPNSFWVWLYLDAAGGANLGFSRFVNVKVSDGSSLTTLTAVQYEQGDYQGAQTATPARFGHSFSCPLWVQRVAIGSPLPPPPTPGESGDEYLIRRERWWPHIASEQFRQFFSMLQVDLFAGNGITAGPVGSPVQGEDPLLEVDWSDDGGHTWSSIHFVRTGKIGAYRQRAILRRMGYSRDRVYRIAVSDPNQWIVVNGYLAAILGTS